MASAESRPGQPWASILAEVRSSLAAGRPVDREVVTARIRALAPDDAERALAQLDRVLSVERARARLSAEPAQAEPPRPTARPLRAALRTRPSLTANMDVRRERDGDTYSLVWGTAPGVVEWEVRIADRVDPRSDYVPIAESTHPGATTSLELPLTDRALRIHLIGRGRGGKLIRRAVISGLSRDNWDERWQRRGSAA